jgi:magnesium chelatase accessory protein
MSRLLDFNVDGADWPNREASTFVHAAGLRWHVQSMGPEDAPVVLMLHGTGASTHSWRSLMPMLAESLRVVAVDLPGHGFTSQAPMLQLSMQGMAMAVGKLLETLNVSPVLIVGHSAGAAIAARLCLDGGAAPAGVISLAGALLKLQGAAGKLFSPTAKLLALNPLVPRFFSWRAKKASVVSDLMGRTGSQLDADGLKYYTILARSAGHTGSALGMMANWDLQGLARQLPELKPKLLLVTASNDRMIPPSDGKRAQALVADSELHEMQGLGHLAHEEQPADIAKLIFDFYDRITK